jgi:hypothetical protein
VLLAGIDEAGLGPNIGPLATACAALRTPDAWTPETPWETLAAACARHRSRGDARPCVADSKVLYARGGVAALEHTLSAFALCTDGGLSFSVASLPGAEPHPCYSRALQPFPPHRDRDEADAHSAALAACLAANGAASVRLDAACLFEPAMNARFASGLNKNRILLMETGARLSGLVSAFPEESILAVVDKQGGRNDYLPFLTELFPGAWTETLTAGAERSVYRVRRAGGPVEIRFVAKGDRDSFATALASMAAKYARERAMAELNRWFGARAPELRPTAGYPVDAKRWRAEMEQRADAPGFMLKKIWRLK